MRILTTILITLSTATLFADLPDWIDDPGAYQFTATIGGGIVLNIAGEQMGDDGDMFAAFDEAGNVRGVGLMLFPPWGPYQGTPVFEVQLRSNNAGDLLSFKYYDASEDAVLDIVETYDFVINDILGDVENPIEFNLAFVTLTFGNASSMSININYESNTEIAGFQFDVVGVDLISASGGDAALNGFTISSGTSTVLVFSLSGATIAIGSGTLITLEFKEISGNTSLNVNNVVISGPGGNSIQNSGPGSIAINSPPELFEYNQSTSQAFYYFILVLINDIDVESNDWVGAFNGDVCVGSRLWDTSLCNGVCDVPVMGDDGTDETNGYMVAGDFPTFKIYDASENLYYTAESSENRGWSYLGMPIVEILSANVSILGCTDPDYCNYEPSATEDDGSCNYLCTGCADESACNYSEDAIIDDGSCYDADENYDCGGNCIADIDCAGDCGGPAEEDECGICEGNGISCEDCAGIENGDNELDNCGTCDNDPFNDCEQDCFGEFGGTAAIDECGVCGGGGIPDGECDCTGNVADCASECGGSAVMDECGICDNNTENDCEKDCMGDWGGIAIVDACGVCGGNNFTGPDCEVCGDGSVPDCFGACPGNSELDECGVCDSDPSNNCVQDCNGNWGGSVIADCASECGGSAVMDECGICDNNTENDCEKDCMGDWGGIAIVDACGVCGDDNSSCTDCSDVVNGQAVIDRCGICSGGNSNHTACMGNGICLEEDCNGNCWGDALVDECGHCDGNGPEDYYDCEENCIGAVNCLGECDSPNGQYSPHFQCENGNVACNAADCNSMDISPYLLPDEFGISKIFPNPFNPITHIQYELTQFGLISIKIYDIQGRVVDQLINEYQSPGHYSLNWNAGHHASGMYIVEMVMQLENNEVSRDLQKILYLK